MSSNERAISISRQALARLPYYARCVAKAKENKQEFISAPAIAAELNLHEVQVRKDLAALSTYKGLPKKGFRVDELLWDIRQVMGSDNINDAVLVGAGSLGHALLAYNGFDDYGMHIVAAFDVSEALIGQEMGGKKVFALSQLPDICRRLHIRIGIITVPTASAQQVCDDLIDSGIQAIWNFAPIHLNAPDHILIQNENIAASLMMLSQHLKERITHENEEALTRE